MNKWITKGKVKVEKMFDKFISTAVHYFLANGIDSQKGVINTIIE